VRGTTAAGPARHLLHAQTDGHLDDARVAMIRLCLTRHLETPAGRMPMPDLELTSDRVRCRALVRRREQIQFDASGES
jgi:hypothetical protein